MATLSNEVKAEVRSLATRIACALGPEFIGRVEIEVRQGGVHRVKIATVTAVDFNERDKR